MKKTTMTKTTVQRTEMTKSVSKKSSNPFHKGTHMSFCTAKSYIDDAYDKRRIARKALKIVRECGLEGNILQTSYFCGVYKLAMRDYRTAQKLSVAAYKKCMADTFNASYRFLVCCKEL